MHPIPALFLLLASIAFCLSAVMAKLGWILRIVFFLIGFGLETVLTTLLLKTPPLQEMIWSGPDLPAITLALFISLIIVSVLSVISYHLIKQPLGVSGQSVFKSDETCIHVEEYAQRTNMTPQEVIENIQSGSLKGFVKGEQWFIEPREQERI